MDRTTRVGVILIGGLALVALLAVALVLGLGMPLWAGLVLLALLDVALLTWAFFTLKVKRPTG